MPSRADHNSLYVSPSRIPSSLTRLQGGWIVEEADRVRCCDWGAGSQMVPCLRNLADSLAEDFEPME